MLKTTVWFSFALLWLASGRLTCLDEDGHTVDWWAIIKLPRISSANTTGSNSVKDGTSYVYMTSTTSMLKLSPHSLADKSGGAFVNTVQQVYSNPSVGVGFYNDEHPDNTTSSTYGHTKGVVGFDGDGGFWLIHSIPRFPPALADGYSFRIDEVIYGQSMLCLSLDTDQLEVAAYQMQYHRPWFYESRMPPSLVSRMPNMTATFGNAFVKDAGSSVTKLKTINGATFVHFGKNTNWNKYLDEDLIEPYLNTDMFWETWMRPWFGSFCTPQYRFNSLNVKDLSVAGQTWHETNDHSKWGIAVHADWVCIGDINRMDSQRTRGGGAACIQHSGLHRLFASMIMGTETCTPASVPRSFSLSLL
ncbi:putative deoxyribonuclease II family protein [Paratrimastix pyriformis]|uniref:Deoxyribonuclease II family protein n=1 Tax=Paratrimastix pyriformis TaxID=342808 RepID=A0ABQ8UWP4_9EUKA|nr:putative deoxyribonuclease II family protein [Paratrimastix pyriformis]